MEEAEEDPSIGEGEAGGLATWMNEKHKIQGSVEVK